MKKIDWNNMSNSEIEVKIVELEYKYEALQRDIENKMNDLINLSKNYKDGKKILNKRINPTSRRKK